MGDNNGSMLGAAMEEFDYVGHITRVRLSQASIPKVERRGSSSAQCAYSALSLVLSEGTLVLRSIRIRAPEVTNQERTQMIMYFRGIWRMLSGYWGSYNTYCRIEIRKQLEPTRQAAGNAMIHFINILESVSCFNDLMEACMLGIAARDAILGCLRNEVLLEEKFENKPSILQVAISICRMPGHETNIFLFVRGLDLCFAKRMEFIFNACNNGLWIRNIGNNRKFANLLSLFTSYANFRNSYISYVRQCVYDEREFIAYYSGDNATLLRLILEPRIHACC